MYRDSERGYSMKKGRQLRSKREPKTQREQGWRWGMDAETGVVVDRDPKTRLF